MKIPLLGQDKSGLIRHGAVLVIGTFAGALCNAGFHMAVGRTLPNAEYGALIAMLGIILAATTPMLALQNTLAHFTSKLLQAGRRDEIMDFFWHWVRLFVVLSAAIVGAATLFRVPLAAFWGGVDSGLVVATFAVLAVSLWMNLFYGLLQGVQAFNWLAWAPQAWGATRLALGWGLTAAVSATALAAIGAQGIGVLVVLALGLGAVFSMHLPSVRAARRPHGTYRYLGTALVCLGGYAMLMNLDTPLAKHYFDAETAGLFAKAATIARTAVFLPVPIATALFPKVTSSGELSSDSWRLLGHAMAFAGLIIAAVAGVCLVFPQLPWSILYGRWSVEAAAPAAALTRAMVLAMSPLALAYLLLNFEMAQQRFRWCLGLVPCGIAYVGGVALFHAHPLQIAAVLGTLNVVAVGLLLAGVIGQRCRPRCA
jgi:O-antigen/teichoic acid export membrane protein